MAIVGVRPILEICFVAYSLKVGHVKPHFKGIVAQKFHSTFPEHRSGQCANINPLCKHSSPRLAGDMGFKLSSWRGSFLKSSAVAHSSEQAFLC